jgi:hypothetical protein
MRFTKKELDYLNSSPSLFDNYEFNITSNLNNEHGFELAKTRQNLFAEVNFDSEDVFNIYKYCFKTEYSKGKIKQEILNNTVISAIKRKGDTSLNYIKEYKVECKWGRRFKVDVALFRNGKLVEVILIKAPASNIKQNHVNALNSQVGEYHRIDNKLYPNLKITQITFLPNVSPYFTKEETIKNFETPESTFLTKFEINSKLEIEEVRVRFDIEGIRECKNKEDINQLFVNGNPITNIMIDSHKIDVNE